MRQIFNIVATLILISLVPTKTVAQNSLEQSVLDEVDLGLSVNWASCNLGAITPHDAGCYFSYGEIIPKQQFTKDNYKYKDIKLDNISGNPLYDAASAISGGVWRIPTVKEWEELKEKCEWTYVTENGVKGQRVTGPNGNSIFLPISGWYDNGYYSNKLKDVGDYGYSHYWASESASYDNNFANSFYVGSWEEGFGEYLKSYGFNIRAVCIKTESTSSDSTQEKTTQKETKQQDITEEEPIPEETETETRIKNVPKAALTQQEDVPEQEDTSLNLDSITTDKKHIMFSGLIEGSSENAQVFNVASIEGELINENCKVLYLDCNSLILFIDKEKSVIKKICTDYVVNLNFIYEDKINVLTRFNDYGAIIITNTHGDGVTIPGRTYFKFEIDETEKFKIQDDRLFDALVNGEIRYKDDECWVCQSFFKKYAPITNHPFIYANYCWSFLGDHMENASFVGYKVKSNVFVNGSMSGGYLNRLVNGYTHFDAVREIANKDSYSNYSLDYVHPCASGNLKQRYFSISTYDPSYKENQSELSVEFSGKINGYKNLKHDKIISFLYYSYSDFQLPTDENVKKVLNNCNNDGKMTCTIPVDKDNDKIYYQLGFEFNGSYYVGEKGVVYMIEEEEEEEEVDCLHICPDDNHPHMIDLGLPSGTKWACCNVGAEFPDESGDFFAWGETETKEQFSDKNYSLQNKNIDKEISGTQYDVAHIKWGDKWYLPTNEQIQELLDYCKMETLDCAPDGVLFKGPNGNKIYLPYFEDKDDDNGIGIYMSGSQSDYVDYIGPNTTVSYAKSLFIFDFPKDKKMTRDEKMQISFLRAATGVPDEIFSGQKIVDWLKISKYLIRPVNRKK